MTFEQNCVGIKIHITGAPKSNRIEFKIWNKDIKFKIKKEKVKKTGKKEKRGRTFNISIYTNKKMFNLN